MKIFTASLFCLLLGFSQFSWADDMLTFGKPEDVDMSAEKLQAGTQLFRDAVDADDIRGAVLLVARNGKVVLYEALGWRNKEADQPMQRDTLFRMASNTKAVVATAVLMLDEQEKISLDDEVGKLLPAFNHVSYSGVKVHHLLSHTSGLRIPGLFLDPLMQKSEKYPKAPNLQLEVNRFSQFAVQEIPGDTFEYNNAGYNILGSIIEVRSGMLLEEFLTRRIYAPLGMKETTNHQTRDRIERMSVVYEREKEDEGQKWKIRFRQDSPMKVPFVRASGGMISTAADFAIFCQMFLNKGTYNGQRLLSSQSVELATMAQTRSIYTQAEIEKRTGFYGFGWHVDKQGVFSHGGSDGTYAWVDPNRKIVGLILTQSPGGKIPRDEFIQAVNAACGVEK